MPSTENEGIKNSLLREFLKEINLAKKLKREDLPDEVIFAKVKSQLLKQYWKCWAFAEHEHRTGNYYLENPGKKEKKGNAAAEWEFKVRFIKSVTLKDVPTENKTS